MNIRLFYHSIISDWNHGNAHFLRGIVKALKQQGHDVVIYEPAGGWSLNNLLKLHGAEPVREYMEKYPDQTPLFYDPEHFNADAMLQDADVVIVHEWNDPDVVQAIGDYRSRHDHFQLWFHDTHHRAVTNPEAMEKFNLEFYDGVLVFGDILKTIYKNRKWGRNIFVWHEAADTSVFKPFEAEKEGDLVWIGNWGDNERTEELMEFIINPAKDLGLSAVFYGVRYPEHAKKLLQDANIEYRNWLPNYKVPEVFSRFRFTMHVPRRPYVQKLPGIPTIRPFEAMACGIPLICSPWNDTENLFAAGKDYLMAKNGNEAKQHIQALLHDKDFSDALASHALSTIQTRHTCMHRAEEFIQIVSMNRRSKAQAV